MSRRTRWPFSRTSFQILGEDVARPGRNSNSLLFKFIPSVSAPVALASHSAAAKCEDFMPPLWPREARLPRILVTWIGIWVREEKESARRRSWPPPSRVVPSRWMGVIVCDIVGDNIPLNEKV